jgi:hypothetical protein
VEVEADTQSALRDAQQVAKRMHALPGPVITAASDGQDAQADFDTTDNLEVTYLKPLRIFDQVIERIADVCMLSSPSEPN